MTLQWWLTVVKKRWHADDSCTDASFFLKKKSCSFEFFFFHNHHSSVQWHQQMTCFCPLTEWINRCRFDASKLQNVTRTWKWLSFVIIYVIWLNHQIFFFIFCYYKYMHLDILVELLSNPFNYFHFICKIVTCYSSET